MARLATYAPLTDEARGALTKLARRHHVKKPAFTRRGPLGLLYAQMDGGRDTFLDGIELAAAEGRAHAMHFMRAWLDLPEAIRETVALENVCVACGVHVSELVAVVTDSLAAHMRAAAELVANSVLPSVVHQLGKSAKRIGGSHADISHRDRALFLQSRKFIPTAKGHPLVQVTNQANAAAAAATASAPSVPSFLDDIRTAVQTKDVIQGHLVAARAEDQDEDV